MPSIYEPVKKVVQCPLCDQWAYGIGLHMARSHGISINQKKDPNAWISFMERVGHEKQKWLSSQKAGEKRKKSNGSP